MRNPEGIIIPEILSKSFTANGVKTQRTSHREHREQFTTGIKDLVVREIVIQKSNSA
jgi:hypothetical protein